MSELIDALRRMDTDGSIARRIDAGEDPLEISLSLLKNKSEECSAVIEEYERTKDVEAIERDRLGLDMEFDS
jgi:hypothetical protein